MVVAAVNWTVVLTSAATGLTAIVVAGIGYLGHRLTAARAEHQISEETDRFRSEQDEQRRQHRQDAYRDLLSAERRLILSLESHPELDDVTEQIESYFVQYNIATLIAPADVAREVIALSRWIRDALTAIRATGYGPSYIALAGQWTDARRRVIDTMRADVAADAAGVGDWAAEAYLQAAEAAAVAAEELQPTRQTGPGPSPIS